MIAMALGNVWGGRLADKSPSPDRLYGRLLLAAVWIALIPFAGRYLIGGISLLLAAFITRNFLVWAALFACLLVFAFPCILLGTVTPSLVKYAVSSLDSNGRTVGELNALNTIGSIIGTFHGNHNDADNNRPYNLGRTEIGSHQPACAQFHSHHRHAGEKFRNI